MRVVPGAAVLRTVQGAPVPLQEVAVQARLRDLLSEVTVTRSYRNAERVAIEAVYTFPLPVEAVLLDVEVTIAGRTRRGQVVERKQAEQGYEAAVDAGDAAIMIERPAPDLYTMNLGNLLPGTSASIAFRYATVLRRQRGRVRFHHPTTIAPRYGQAPLEPHQQPEFSLLDERACRMEIAIEGMLAHGDLRSPTHDIVSDRAAGRVHVRARGGRLLMDRDFVLDIAAEAVLPPALLCEPDDELGHACIAILHPDLPPALEAAPRDLKIVIDCSGSMQGDSIAQARIAVQRMLEALRPQDRFNIVLFGSQHRVLFSEMMAGDDRSVARAQRVVLDAMADMGGTEMGPALAAAYALPTGGGRAATLVLVTDGAVGDPAPIIRAARDSGHRVFTVGVGSAVAEGLVQELARTTGGACELVTPREDMAERILRHFRRIDQGGARLDIDWPGFPIEAIGIDEPVFAGDTALVFARFATPPEGEARIAAILPDGRSVTAYAPATAMPAGERGTIARLVASRRLFELGRRIDAAQAGERRNLETQAVALAVRYQLLSPWTNWLLVVAQHGRPGELPVLRKVPQTLAAGWHGMGTVQNARSRMVFAEAAPPPAMSPAPHDDDLTYDLPEPRAKPMSPRPTPRHTPERSLFSRLLERTKRREPRLDDLAGLPGVNAAVIAALRALLAEGFDESAVVAAFLALLAEGSLGVPLDRHGRRAIRQLLGSTAVADHLKRRVHVATAGVLQAATVT